MLEARDGVSGVIRRVNKKRNRVETGESSTGKGGLKTEFFPAGTGDFLVMGRDGGNERLYKRKY